MYCSKKSCCVIEQFSAIHNHHKANAMPSLKSEETQALIFHSIKQSDTVYNFIADNMSQTVSLFILHPVILKQ